MTHCASLMSRSASLCNHNVGSLPLSSMHKHHTHLLGSVVPLQCYTDHEGPGTRGGVEQCGSDEAVCSSSRIVFKAGQFFKKNISTFSYESLMKLLLKRAKFTRHASDGLTQFKQSALKKKRLVHFTTSGKILNEPFVQQPACNRQSWAFGFAVLQCS